MPALVRRQPMSTAAIASGNGRNRGETAESEAENMFTETFMPCLVWRSVRQSLVNSPKATDRNRPPTNIRSSAKRTR